MSPGRPGAIKAGSSTPTIRSCSLPFTEPKHDGFGHPGFERYWRIIALDQKPENRPAGYFSLCHNYDCFCAAKVPLQNRFMLFLIPFVLLLMAEGFRGIYWLVAKWKPDFAAVVSGILALAVVWQIVPITYEKAISGAKEDIRPVIEYVAENRLQDDIVYVFHRTDPVFQYYAPFYGLDTGNIMIGVYDPRKRVAIQNFEDDVDRLVGKSRVWFIFSELIDCVECEGEDTQAFYLEHINKFGVVVDTYDGAGADAYLYDLSR